MKNPLPTLAPRSRFRLRRRLSAASVLDLTAAVTLGVNVKPLSNVLIRPEIRFDKAIDGNKAFTDSSKSRQFTGGLDVIFSF